MRKRIIEHGPQGTPSGEPRDWLDLERVIQIEVTSEDAAHPIELALVHAGAQGWRAEGPGEQTIRLLFDEPVKLGKLGTQAEAVAAVEAGLAAKRGGARKVYRVDVGPDETVFGVALTDGCGGDASVMKEIDFKPLRSTGHLPYELLVSKGEAFALHGKFRIAVNFPDLSMMGSHSFMNIRCAPDSIESALKAVAGGK